MARSEKYSKNLAKVQDMLDGNVQTKIQSGYTPTTVTHKIGDIWTDSDGVEWEQMNGYRSKSTKINVGIFSKVCDDCKKPCLKSFDKDTYNRMKRCYGCQTTFEIDLKFMRIGKNGNKWQHWVRLQELKRWDSMVAEMEQLVLYNHEQDKKNPFDKSVVNAMANANVSMEIKKNT